MADILQTSPAGQPIAIVGLACRFPDADDPPALLDMVLANYAIDKTKVAVTGYSMGGAGSWHFAEKFPERFRAAIPISATPPISAAGWQLPVLAIHSRDDEVNPFDPTEARIAEAESRCERQVIPLAGVTHYDIASEMH